MFEEKLINEVQKFSCIYDKTNVSYRNKLIKEKAWSAIASAVGRSMEQCNGRWKTLRERYVKEFQKSASGSAAADYKTKWQYTDAMSFMKDDVKPKQTRHNFLDDSQNIFDERNGENIENESFCEIIEDTSYGCEVQINTESIEEPVAHMFEQETKARST